MISNEHSNERRPYQDSGEKTIASESFEVERKLIQISLNENRIGKFVRITETVNGRRNKVIVPFDGAAKLLAALQAVLGTETAK